MDIEIARFVTGPIETNTYVVSSGAEEALVFDPSSPCDEVLDYSRQKGLSVKAVVLTHAHFDHIMGIAEILESHGDSEVWVHPEEKILLSSPEFNGSTMIGAACSYRGPVRELAEGPLEIGGIEMTVFHVPGHSPGGCAFLFEGQCIVGDTLFAGSIGRSDLPGGDGAALVRGIKIKLLSLPAETVVLPGHGGRSTIGREERLNPFLQ